MEEHNGVAPEAKLSSSEIPGRALSGRSSCPPATYTTNDLGGMRLAGALPWGDESAGLMTDTP